MEKQVPNVSSDCDSMTTVTVKDDYSNACSTTGMEYPEPPPSYRGGNLKQQRHPMVQVARIIAITTITIAAMLSTAIIVSAWISTNNCQSSTTLIRESAAGLQGVGGAPKPESLIGNNKIDDLDSAETKILNNKKTQAQNSKESDSTESEDISEDNNNNNEDASEEDNQNDVTMIKLPLELNLQEHMFEKLNHRSHMNCVIEKKKAEEIVDEQSKSLPSILGLNITTDPRYLRFTGEKMIVSCGSEDPKEAMQLPTGVHMFPPMPPPPQHAPGQHQQGPPLPPYIMDLIQAATGAAAEAAAQHQQRQGPPPHPMMYPPSAVGGPHNPFFLPQRRSQNPPTPSFPNSPRIQMIGPIPITASATSSGPHQNPLEMLLQQVITAESQVEPIFSQFRPQQKGFLQNLVPIFNNLPEESNSGPIFFTQGQQEQEQPRNNIDPFLQPKEVSSRLPEHGRSIQFQLPGSFLTQGQVLEDDSLEQQAQAQQLPISELLQRERALPHPIPIQPRHHIQHVIRPRRSADNIPAVPAEEEKAKPSGNRVKRCACDCACKK